MKIALDIITPHSLVGLFSNLFLVQAVDRLRVFAGNRVMFFFCGGREEEGGQVQIARALAAVPV